MRPHPSLSIAALLAASLVCAENLTEANVERAQSVINSAVEAYGGTERLSAMKTVVIEHKTTTYAVGQSLKADPPWDRNVSSGISGVDFDNKQFVSRNHGSGGGFEFDGGTVINDDASFQLNYRNGTVARIAEPDFDNASGPMVRVTPAMLVRNLQSRAQNTYFLDEVEVDGDDYEVIGFSMTVGPAITLYFDKSDHLLKRSERIFAGVGLVEYRYNNYDVVDGIPFNQSFELIVTGDLNLVRQNVSTKINVSLDEMLAVDASLDSIPAVVPDPLQRREIADGVYLIGGAGNYAMFVDMGDYIVASGGTAGIPDRIALLREVVGDKPIRYAVMTHHHFDHVVGVSAYESEGATLIAAESHEAVIRRAASDGESLNVRTVDNRLTLESDSRTVEIIDVGPTAHTEHLLITYLPQEKLIFEADHFALPQAGPVAPAVSSTRTFAAALSALEIDVEKIATAHSSRIGTRDELHLAVEREVQKFSRN